MSWYLLLLLVTAPAPGALGTSMPKLITVQPTTQALCPASGAALVSGAMNATTIYPPPAANQKYVFACAQF